jgi:putative peptidoglycan lipid II flippase
VLFNLSIITAALIFARKVEEPSIIFAAGVVVGGLLQLAFQIPFLWREGMRFRWGLSFTHPAVKKVARLMIPGIFAVGISQINFATSRIIAAFLEEGSVSSLYFAGRVQELTLGIFSIAFSIALLPTFSEMAARKDIPALKKTLIFSLKLIFFITIPAMVGLVVLNRPIIQVLFERGFFDAQSTAMSSSCLLYFALGLPFLSSVKIFAPAFYSLKDTKTPVIVAFFVMISYIGLSLLLIGPMRVSGIALALSVSSILNFLGLFILLEKKIGRVYKKGIFISAVKSFFFAGTMGLGVWWFMSRFDFQRFGFPEKLGILAAAVSLGLCLYFILNLLFNHEDLQRLRDIFSKEKILSDKEAR